MKTNLLRIGLTAAALATLGGGAIAATPESGKVSNAAPTIKWSGDTTNSYLVLNPMGNAAEQVPCDGTQCDLFTLTVEDDAPTLEIAVNIDDDDATAGIRVERPDGKVEYDSGDSNTKTPFKLKLKDVKKGVHEIGIVDNFVGTITYKASATLASSAAPAPTPVTEPPAQATPAPTAAPQPGQAAPAPPTVTVQNAKGSAKKLKKARKLVLTASSSAPLTSVTAEILKGAKRVAAANVARLEGTQKLTIKLKKGLKKGSYVLRVVGSDAQSRRIQGEAKLKVSK